MKRFAGKVFLTFGILCLALSPTLAAKGDRVTAVRKSSPLLEGRQLDLRFASFAQGIWASDDGACNGLTSIDRAAPGSVLAVFRGLLETPGRICLVYGAEQGAETSQRAALNCDLASGEEALGLVTVQRRGENGLMFQDGEQPPRRMQFCRTILPVTSAPGQ